MSSRSVPATAQPAPRDPAPKSPASPITSRLEGQARIEREEQDAAIDKLVADMSSELRAEVLALMAAGQKIDAIKRVREVTGAGLYEAKRTVELTAEK